MSERCHWCGVVHEKNDKVPRRGDVVVLFSPFFSHPEGDQVIKVYELNHYKERLWIQRHGTSGGEDTPVSCIKTILREGKEIK